MWSVCLSEWISYASTTMTCQNISEAEAVKEQLVVLSGYLKSSDIAHITHISKRTVDHVLQLKWETGSVVHTPLTRGWPRLLNGLDIAVRFIYLTTIYNSKSIWLWKYIESLIEQTPNIFMSELQFELQEARGVHAPSQRIQEALKKWGSTQKCMSLSSFLRPSTLIHLSKTRSLRKHLKGMKTPCWVSDLHGWELRARTAHFCWRVSLQSHHNKAVLCMVSNWDMCSMSWLLCPRKAVSPCS